MTLDRVVLGRLGQDRETGRWQLDWRAGWKRTSTEWIGSGEAEHAEGWACNEIAELLAIERHAIDIEKPWGDPPPPGIA